MPGEDQKPVGTKAQYGAPVGIVFNVQRYSVHDGPGIRTVAFLKGCPLRCKWCSNPESQSLHPEILYNETVCTRCGKCVRACPEGCIDLTEEGVLVNREMCTRCGKCVVACLSGGLRMIGRKMTVDDVMLEVEKDRAFYRRSGGGLTLSGGEPTLQAEFARALARTARARGLAVAIETCGYQDWKAFMSVVQYADLVMYDLKVMDEHSHRNVTGVSNALVLNNLRLLSRAHHSVIVRIPVIPGFTDSEENMVAAADFINQLGTIRTVELIPYHRLGMHKYAMLGREYSLKGIVPPPEDQLERLRAIFVSRGLHTMVGG